MAKQLNLGDVEIRKMLLHSASGDFNIIPNFLELNIYENIFRNSLTATAVIADSLNLPQKLPIVGEETLEIELAMPGIDGGPETIIKPTLLHVNSLTDRYFTKPKAQNFSLELISEKHMCSIHSKVSRAYRGKKISDIVQNIYEEYLDNGKHPLNIEPTERTENLIIPNMSPISAINWLANRAIPAPSLAVNYVFYETCSGSYFVSLDSLAQLEPVTTFFHRQRVDDHRGVEHASKNEFKIDKFTFLHQFDKHKSTKKGVYASKLITHDIVRKKIETQEYQGFNEWFAFNHLGDFPPLSNSDMELQSSNTFRTSYSPPLEGSEATVDEKQLGKMVDSRVDFYPKHDQMYSLNKQDLYDNQVEKWKLRRNGNLGVYDNITILVEVGGISGLRVGQNINLILPSPETTDTPSSSDKVEDKYLSGKYMITAIRHIFSKVEQTDPRIQYDMQLELTRDGLGDVVPIREARK